MNIHLSPALIQSNIEHNVACALAEDVGSGDITADLIPETNRSQANIIVRESAFISGIPWVNEVFRQVDPSLSIQWLVSEGDAVIPNQTLCLLQGLSRSILTAERCALNFLQFMSGVTTKCRYLSQLTAQTSVKLLDTRKTLPGLRIAQKYAVSQGGCYNHRLGLYDVLLIKENHIQACGSIQKAIEKAKKHHESAWIVVEVELLSELDQALQPGVSSILLDNFSNSELKQAVKKVAGRVLLEASGNIHEHNMVSIAKTGVDFISLGALTKHCRSIDLSLKIIQTDNG